MIRAMHAESHRYGCSPRAFLEFSHECDLISASRRIVLAAADCEQRLTELFIMRCLAPLPVLDAGFPGIPSLH